MDHNNDLEMISSSVIQNIYQCLFQAVGEDYQEAESHLGFQTHISKPFLIWDLINRNLINAFLDSNVIYSAKKRGMWEVLLLYDNKSGMLLSFMKDTRFVNIRKVNRGRQPQYIRALLLLNKNLQAENKQHRLFSITEPESRNEQFKNILDSLCDNFKDNIEGKIKHHALVVFSSNYGQISSLKAYILDSDLDIVVEHDWLNMAKPIISNIIDIVTTDNKKLKQPILTTKASERLRQKELVALKSFEEADIDHL